ncbi:MAG: hypothetical protein Q7J06_12940 [Bacteroidales bacterium]|nr:hypothetical protein [Bacteroidales bacterium]
MKTSIIALFFVVVLMSGCTISEQDELKDVVPEEKASEAALEQQTENFIDTPILQENKKMEGMEGVTSPGQTIYKTKGDYYDLAYVGMFYNQFGKWVVSSPPAVVTMKIRMESPDWEVRPEKLHKGYFLDKGAGGTGIKHQMAFLKLTYEEYASLKKQPSVDELFDLIIDDNPITELYECGASYNLIGDIYYKDDDFINKINEIIDNNQLDTICEAIRRPSNKTHFETVWSGNGYKHMTIFVDQAYLGGINIPIVAGDEIGVFDGDLCVGTGVLRGPIVDVFQVNVSADDPTTSKIDGFIEGHPIKYKLWRFSNAYEFTNVTAEYNSTLNNTFIQLGTAMVSLKGELKPEKAEAVVKEDGIIEINCAKEGKRPTYFDLTTGKENPGGKHCCFGLKGIGPKTPQEELEKGICMGVSGSLGICSPCGNNVCEFEYEDSCNCPEDCGRK